MSRRQYTMPITLLLALCSGLAASQASAAPTSSTLGLHLRARVARRYVKRLNRHYSRQGFGSKRIFLPDSGRVNVMRDRGTKTLTISYRDPFVKRDITKHYTLGTKQLMVEAQSERSKTSLLGRYAGTPLVKTEHANGTTLSFGNEAISLATIPTPKQTQTIGAALTNVPTNFVRAFTLLKLRDTLRRRIDPRIAVEAKIHFAAAQAGLQSTTNNGPHTIPYVYNAMRLSRTLPERHLIPEYVLAHWHKWNTPTKGERLNQEVRSLR